jgi:glycosyltransferase involved in cell wall biosynthesis
VKRICIVTTRNISYNPRVVKEADAFSGRGYDVTVVTLNIHNGQYKFDEELMRSRKWILKTVNFRKEVKEEKLYWLYLSLQQKMYSVLSRISFGFGFAERAALKGYGALARLAVKQKADFYIAHHAEALGIACTAAKKNKVKFGFDAEDFHTGMNESKKPSENDELLNYIESKYLPHCAYFTAASKGIGEAYAGKYKVPEKNIILNVFPKEEVDRSDGYRTPVRFYWYSQVIGPNRSLETLLEAAAMIKEPFEIHLRGSFQSTEYKKTLDLIIQSDGLKDKVFFHPPILSEQIIKDAARFDVGLALESDISMNRNICVTNKIFSYLMSGLAIVGTDTYGQKDIFVHFEEAVRICKKNNPADLADSMLYFILNPDKLQAARRAARRAAESRFNWEIESEALIEGFEKALLAKSKTKLVMSPEIKPG